jgi:hypothetical protein
LPVPTARRDRWPGDCAKQSQFRRSGRTDKYLMEKELWRIEHARDLRKTNPISRLRISDCGLGTDLRWDAWPPACVGRNVRNEPNFGRCGRREPPLFQYSSVPAFQSSGVGRGQMRKTKPICGDACVYKQTQFPATPGGTGGNRAKQSQFGGTKCAKQTQFAEAGRIG